MSSIDAPKQQSMQTDLNDLQAEYARKKKALVEENDSELRGLKTNYAERKASLQSENEAAINHIRKQQSDTVETASEERGRLNKNFTNNTEVVQKNYDQKLKEMRDKRQQQLAQAQEDTHQQVHEIQDHSQAEVQKIRDDGGKEVADIKEHQNREVAQINEYGSKRVQIQEKQNENTLRNEIDRGRVVYGKTRARNEEEEKSVRATGDQKIAEDKQDQEKKVQRQDEFFTKKYEQSQKQWASKEQNLNTQYSDRMEHTKKAYETDLHNQGDRFQSIYTKNEDANKESLQVQAERLTKGLAVTKKAFLTNSEKYNDRAADPFYKVADRGSTMSEDSSFYVLKAYVPEHEKDNVKVIFEKDKAIVSGQRSFQDKLNENGKTVSTSSYQTFREEMPFDKPVIMAGMTREREGDWVTYKIPKMHTYSVDKKV